MASTPRAAPDLAAYLESLSKAPGRRLGVGWPAGAVRDRLERAGTGDLWIADLADDRDPGPFDEIFWQVADAEDLTPTVAELRRRTSDAGRLMAVVPSEGVGPGAGGRRRGLPNRDERLVRRLVRALSETGFTLRDERRFTLGDSGCEVVVASRDPFVVRPYRAGDEAAILELFPTCFHAQRSLEHWRWKYLGNPYGTLKISMAFAPDDELAAHYASYPMPFWREGRSFLALQMGDTMTDPKFREQGRGRAGLLPRTVRHFFSIHRDGSYDFYYGFNTGPIQRFCQWFIGGTFIRPVGYWVRDLDPEAPGEWRSGRYRVRRARGVDTGWDRFFDRVAPRYRFLVRRDARWVDWRYLRCPDADFVVLAATRWGRLWGWSVFRRRDDLLIWGDALFDPRHPAAVGAVLSAAVRHPDLAGARRLAAWFSPRPRWWSERLPDLGLHAATEPDGLGMVALEDGDEDAIERLQGLYYTMGDGDLF